MSNPLTKLRAAFSPNAGQNIVAARAFLTDSAGAVISLAIPAKTLVNRAFIIRISGLIPTAAGTDTLLFEIMKGISGTSVLATHTAIQPSAGANRAFVAEWLGIGDAVGDTIDTATTAQLVGRVLSNTAVAVSNAQDPDVEVTISVAATGSAAGPHVVILKNFELELL